MPNYSIIAALDRNRLIGMDNKLPWRIPEDLAYFRAKTINHTVIMGRKTWISLGKALDLRTNIVLTRDHSLVLSSIIVVHDITELENYLEEEENFIIGGASIFNQFLHWQTDYILQESKQNSPVIPISRIVKKRIGNSTSSSKRPVQMAI
jgi:dihydrofolate reductase